MRKKNLIDLTVGDLSKLAVLWYFVRPVLKVVDARLSDAIVSSKVLDTIMDKTEELEERNHRRKADRLRREQEIARIKREES